MLKPRRGYALRPFSCGGVPLTFTSADQETYLQIVHDLAQEANAQKLKISLNSKDLDYQALQWATRHNGRSGRTARQFIDFWQSKS